MATVETHLVYRDKAEGIGYVDIYDDGISYQKADSLVKGMFPTPMKFWSESVKMEDGRKVRTRKYFARGW